MGATLIGLDGAERTFAEAFAKVDGCSGADHGLRTVAGYVLRRTDGAAHEDIAEYHAATDYGAAREAARDLARAGGYAVVDWKYGCGCRALG